MLISYGWRIRAGEQIFGPAARIEQLYGAVKYMPDTAVWEWKDANGDWHDHITVGRWRENLRRIRWLYNTTDQEPTDNMGEAPAENLSRKLSIDDEYRPKAEETRREISRRHGRMQRERGIWMPGRASPKGWNNWKKEWSQKFLEENPDFEPWDVEAYNKKLVEEAKKKRERYNAGYLRTDSDEIT